MSCFPCFASKRSNSRKEQSLPVARAKDSIPAPAPSSIVTHEPRPSSAQHKNKKDETNTPESINIAAQTFTFRELATATKNFRQECLIGEGGFGRVYKGKLQATGQDVAVKQLDKNIGVQGNKEFLVEVMVLSLLHHTNLVNLIGYCADGDQRLLVYEYMPLGSLEDHLLAISEGNKPLNWLRRMKIASGIAQGVEYLHEKANPPVIYRDLKSSNVLLDEEYHPRLTDFGLAKLGHSGNKMTHAPSRVMGTYGYCAPEYERTGELTLKSDIYSFGVVLLELITGRRAIDTSRPNEDQNLVSWAQPIFRDPKRFPEMADPLLGKEFPEKSLNQAVGIAAMCLQEEASVRPLISDVVAALSFLTTVPPGEAILPHSPTPPSPASKPSSDHHEKHHHHHENQGVSTQQNGDASSSDNEEEGDSEDDRGNNILRFDKEDDGDSSESLYGIEDEDFAYEYSSKSIKRGPNSVGKSYSNLSSSGSSNILGETSEDESSDEKS